jgi:predicted transcriptional regulator
MTERKYRMSVIDRFLASDISDQFGLEKNERFILLVLANRAGYKTSCFPSQEYLAHYCNISKSTVKRALQMLEKKEIITVRRDGKINEYQLNERIINSVDNSVDRINDRVHHEPYHEKIGFTMSPEQGSPCTLENNNIKKIKKINKKKVPKILFPDSLPLPAWKEFLNMRRKMRKTMTPLAVKLNLEKLEKLRAEGHDPEKVIKQSIELGYAGLFPLRSNNNFQRTGYNPQSSHPYPKTFYKATEEVRRTDEEVERSRQMLSKIMKECNLRVPRKTNNGQGSS